MKKIELKAAVKRAAPPLEVRQEQLPPDVVRFAFRATTDAILKAEADPSIVKRPRLFAAGVLELISYSFSGNGRDVEKSIAKKFDKAFRRVMAERLLKGRRSRSAERRENCEYWLCRANSLEHFETGARAQLKDWLVNATALYYADLLVRARNYSQGSVFDAGASKAPYSDADAVRIVARFALAMFCQFPDRRRASPPSAPGFAEIAASFSKKGLSQAW